MTDRHYFTAPDGSRRWCSRELLLLERHIRNYPDAPFTDLLRYGRDLLLAPKPTGLRLRYSVPHREWYLTHYDHGLVGYLMPGAPGVWSALAVSDAIDDCYRVGGASTLADCVRALVKAVKEGGR
jgi:hypothetical protein